MIATRGLTRRLGTIAALEDVTLAVESGKSLAVVGPSGSGKTTLLRLLAGLERPDAGEVLLGGETASSPSVLVPPGWRGIGMAFQRPALWPHLSVADNVGFPLSGRPCREVRERVRELAEALDLAGVLERRPHELSGGEAQRVALARALAASPRRLLLDEPFASLDEARREMAAALLRAERARSGATLVVAAHSAEDARALCDAVALLREGRLAGLDAPAGGGPAAP